MGESREQTLRRRAAEMRAFRDVLLFAVVFGGAVLANALFGLLLLEVFGSLETHPAGPSEGGADLSRRLGNRGAPTA